MKYLICTCGQAVAKQKNDPGGDKENACNIAVNHLVKLLHVRTWKADRMPR